MTTKDALIRFYQFNKLNLTDDFNAHCVRVYIGCILAPVPNIQARKKYLVYHDMHHIITGYSIKRVGESEVSAWELGTGTYQRPIIMIMNLFALSTGFVLEPKRVYRAYLLGCRSNNLYRYVQSTKTESATEIPIDILQKENLNIKSSIRLKSLRIIEFFMYLFVSMIIHISMLFIGKFLLFAERIKLCLKKRN